MEHKHLQLQQKMEMLVLQHGILFMILNGKEMMQLQEQQKKLFVKINNAKTYKGVRVGD